MCRKFKTNLKISQISSKQEMIIILYIQLQLTLRYGENICNDYFEIWH